MSDQPQHSSVKETVISIIISLAMALVAKAYVVEAFVIPTGSMAPTLLGKHMLFESDQTGNEWTVNPWFFGATADGQTIPRRMQGGSTPQGMVSATVTDPMTTSRVNPPRRNPRAGYTLTGEAKRLRAGDRILVQKMLYELFGPTRYDVVVFKNPEDPTQNFIKRLVGLAGEAVILVDGDVYTAAPDNGSAPTDWDAYEIRPKPERVQRDLWRPIFSTEYTPLAPVDAAGRRLFITPWSGDGWTTADQRVFTTESTDPTTLTWNNELWPITDYNPYNEVHPLGGFQGGRSFLDPEHYFPVADLRLRAGLEPQSDGLRCAASIQARGCTFEAILDGTTASLRMREGEGQWRTLASKQQSAPAPGEITEVEFWHCDQRLTLFIDGKKILEATYDWNPSERLERVVGVRAEDVARRDIILQRPKSYEAAIPTVSWRFAGAPLSMHRVGLDKDIFYRPDNTDRAANPHDVVVLTDEQLFVLGDNSAASADGRKWKRVNDEVKKIDPTVGVVPERLLLGKAFFVYFPAPHTLGKGIPIPDLGRMRAIN